MHILPMRLFLPLAQEIVLRIVGRCFKDEPLRATTSFHKLWTSTQMFIYRKGHTGFVCYVFVFNVKAIGPWSCSRIFTIGTTPFPNPLSLYFIGTSWSICHPSTSHLLGKTCACSFLQRMLFFLLSACLEPTLFSRLSSGSMFSHSFHATPTATMHTYLLN